MSTLSSAQAATNLHLTAQMKFSLYSGRGMLSSLLLENQSMLMVSQSWA